MNQESGNNKNYDNKPQGDRRGFNNNRMNAEEIFANIVKVNQQRDQSKLRPYLTGKVLFQITDIQKGFLIDWTGDKLKVEEVSADKEGIGADCTISMAENTLSRIASGDINPQIAMLSTKVQITGKVAFAVYVFNLITN